MDRELKKKQTKKNKKKKIKQGNSFIWTCVCVHLVDVGSIFTALVSILLTSPVCSLDSH